MNGIDKITARIDADTQAEIDRILGDANAQAETIGAKYRAQAEAEDADLLAKGQRAAAEREERLISAAQMEARKSLLTVKQELVERAYQRALEKLCTLPREQYVELLAAMLVYVPGDTLKIVVVTALAPVLRRTLAKAVPNL